MSPQQSFLIEPSNGAPSSRIVLPGSHITNLFTGDVKKDTDVQLWPFQIVPKKDNRTDDDVYLELGFIPSIHGKPSVEMARKIKEELHNRNQAVVAHKKAMRRSEDEKRQQLAELVDGYIKDLQVFKDG